MSFKNKGDSYFRLPELLIGQCVFDCVTYLYETFDFNFKRLHIVFQHEVFKNSQDSVEVQKRSVRVCLCNIC